MKNIKIKSKWVDVLRRLLLVVIGAALGINVYMINANRLVGNQLPMPFGYGAAVVLSNSMEPTFSKGDLIVVREAESFLVDDIIVYQDGNSLVVHRIIELDENTVTTKGDANNAADEPVDVGVIKGKVICWIPKAGSLVEFMKTPVGTICIIVAAIALVEIPRRREKQKDDKVRQHIIDEIQQLRKEQQE